MGVGLQVARQSLWSLQRGGLCKIDSKGAFGTQPSGLYRGFTVMRLFRVHTARGGGAPAYATARPHLLKVYKWKLTYQSHISKYTEHLVGSLCDKELVIIVMACTQRGGVCVSYRGLVDSAQEVIQEKRVWEPDRRPGDTVVFPFQVPEQGTC